MDQLPESPPESQTPPPRANGQDEEEESPMHSQGMTQPLETQLPEMLPATEPKDNNKTNNTGDDGESVRANVGSPIRAFPLEQETTGVITMPRIRDTNNTTITHNNNIHTNPTDDDPTTLDSVQVRIEDPPPPLPLPLKNKEFSRIRSISRVFNSVPSDRPEYARAQHDLMEYYGHLAILQTSPERVLDEERNLQLAAGGHWTFRKYGRLFSRMQMACLSMCMGSVQILPTDERSDRPASAWSVGQRGVLLAKNVSSTMWKELKMDLECLRNYLLRKDANTYVPVQRRGSRNDNDDDNNISIPPPNETLDHETEKHAMFQGDYKLVVHLLDVHAVCQKFREDLSAIFQDPDASSNAHIRDAADAYEQALDDLFDHYHQDIPAERIPRALKNFVLKDLFQQRKHPAEVAQKLYTDSLQVAQEGTTRMYCFANVKAKFHDLLLKWAESILEPPTLIQLGYGGVNAPLPNDEREEDDVSSYGLDETAANDDNDDEEENMESEAPRASPPKPRARGKSDSIAQLRRPHTSPTAERRFSIPFGRSFEDDDEKRQPTSFSDDDSSKKSEASGMVLGGNDDDNDDEDDSDKAEKTEASSALVRLKSPAKKTQSSSKARRHPGKMPRRRSSTDTEVSTTNETGDKKPSFKKRKTAADWFKQSTAILDSSSDSDDDYEWLSDRKERDQREPEIDRDESPKSKKRHPRGHIDTGNSTQQEEDLWRDDDEYDYDDDDATQNKFRRKRLPWTQDEADAVHDGYHQFGTKWSMVKANDTRLQNRTDVQIKDKFRTMVKQGLIKVKK